MRQKLASYRVVRYRLVHHYYLLFLFFALCNIVPTIDHDEIQKTKSTSATNSTIQTGINSQRTAQDHNWCGQQSHWSTGEHSSQLFDGGSFSCERVVVIYKCDCEWHSQCRFNNLFIVVVVVIANANAIIAINSQYKASQHRQNKIRLVPPEWKCAASMPLAIWNQHGALLQTKQLGARHGWQEKGVDACRC